MNERKKNTEPITLKMSEESWTIKNRCECKYACVFLSFTWRFVEIYRVNL